MAGNIIATETAGRGFPEAFVLRLTDTEGNPENVAGRTFHAECRDSPDRASLIIDTLTAIPDDDPTTGIVRFYFTDTTDAPEDGYLDVVELVNGELSEPIFDGDVFRYTFYTTVSGVPS